jgi:hypothetical protein
MSETARHPRQTTNNRGQRWSLPRVPSGLAALLLFLFIVGSALFFTTWPASDMRTLAGGRLLDETPGYTAAFLRAQLEAYGPGGRALYARFLLADMVYAALFGAAVACGIAAAGRRFAPPVVVRVAAGVPLVAALCDWLENAGLASLLAVYPERVPTAEVALGGLTAVKLALVQASFAALVLACVGAAVGATARRWRPSRADEPGAPTSRA